MHRLRLSLNAVVNCPRGRNVERRVSNLPRCLRDRLEVNNAVRYLRELYPVKVDIVNV